MWFYFARHKYIYKTSTLFMRLRFFETLIAVQNVQVNVIPNKVNTEIYTNGFK